MSQSQSSPQAPYYIAESPPQYVALHEVEIVIGASFISQLLTSIAINLLTSTGILTINSYTIAYCLIGVILLVIGVILHIIFTVRKWADWKSRQRPAPSTVPSYPEYQNNVGTPQTPSIDVV